MLTHVIEHSIAFCHQALDHAIVQHLVVPPRLVLARIAASHRIIGIDLVVRGGHHVYAVPRSEGARSSWPQQPRACGNLA